MCGRFTLTTPLELLEELFGVSMSPIAAGFTPLFNIAPTDPAPIFTSERGQEGRAVARIAAFGLSLKRPGWPAGPILNARSETARTSTLFGAAFETRRCLVPADGFYEWTGVGRDRGPRYFQRPDQRPFAFAGLQPHLAPDCFVILTAAAAPSVSGHHDRMPLRLDDASARLWLDPNVGVRDAEGALKGAFEAEWTSRPVGRAVSNPRDKSSACLAAPDPVGRQRSLF
jgi:putative SOS response-associated peptidase YedK